MLADPRIFKPDLEGSFRRRPNRFVVEVETPRGLVCAHCPNPGRLEEILLPGRRVILERSRNSGRKTTHTLVAAEYRGHVISLYASRANRIAGDWILPRLYPGFSPRGEVPLGRSRVDWLLEKDHRRIWVEVKACTLVERETAMFPDAPSLRAVRHVRELSGLRGGDEGVVLVVVMNPEARRFLPNPHTDPLFAATVLECSPRVAVRAVSVETRRDGTLRVADDALPVDLSPGRTAAEDRGAYLVVMEIPESVVLTVGRRLPARFEPGWYIYTGRASRGLASRVARHLRKTKTRRWHIDYLSGVAKNLRAYPIAGVESRECELAAEIAEISVGRIPGFGSSDCGCPSHLCYFRTNPASMPVFHETVLAWRHEKSFPFPRSP